MWIQFGLSCYFFSDGPEIWSDARRMCKSFEADLVVITGDRDQAFLNRELSLLALTQQLALAHQLHCQ